MKDAWNFVTVFRLLGVTLGLSKLVEIVVWSVQHTRIGVV